MLTITVGAQESYDSQREEFVTLGGTLLMLEHSLVSLAAWESKWEIPFLVQNKLTDEQLMDYIRFMTLNHDISDEIYAQFSDDNIDEINKYIGRSMTATTINNEKKNDGPVEVMTAEVLYYLIVAHQIDFQCQYWHINRLLMLIRVINHKNAAQDKTPKRVTGDDLAARRAENARRRAEAGSKG